MERFEFIKKAKSLGLSLEEIRDILVLHDQREAPCAHVLAILDHKLDQVDAVLRDLRYFRQELARLREESHARLDGPADESRVCSIIERGIHARGELALA